MLSQIEQLIPDLSRAEQRVARWIMAHPRQAVEGKLAQVARQCGTSQPTVIRFCRRVGMDGFRDFTLKMSEALSRPAGSVHRDVRADDSSSDAVGKVLDSSIHALSEIRASAAAMPIDDAVFAMTRARQLAFVGLGASGHVAADACHKFFRLGIPCSALTDSPGTMQFAAICSPDDVLVITSHSGSWDAHLRATGLALERGAIVIAVTAPASPLSKIASIVLPCAAQEDTSVYTPMSSRLAHLALLDALQVALALALGEPAVDQLRRSKDALREANPAVVKLS